MKLLNSTSYRFSFSTPVFNYSKMDKEQTKEWMKDHYPDFNDFDNLECVGYGQIVEISDFNTLDYYCTTRDPVLSK